MYFSGLSSIFLSQIFLPPLNFSCLPIFLKEKRSGVKRRRVLEQGPHPMVGFSMFSRLAGWRRAVVLAAGLAATLGACRREPTALPPPPLASVPAYDAAKALHPQVSGEKALAWARAVTAFGPRPSGSEALEKTRVYLEAELKKLGWATQRQTFEDTTPRGRLTFVNLRARWAGDGGDPWARRTPVVVGSHYDTKFFQNITFVGANDGGSGNGLALELARLLAQQPARAERLEIVFFDGEEATVDYTPLDGLHGSRYYAKAWRERPAAERPATALILDMVGKKDIRIRIPTNTSTRLRDLALRAATDAGARAHFGVATGPVLDDHVPLGLAGMEVTNFIDMDYPVWHTAGDTAEQLSAASLALVGKTALLLLERDLLR